MAPFYTASHSRADTSAEAVISETGKALPKYSLVQTAITLS